jgi:hypothetical protein
MTAWIALANEYTLKLFESGFCSSSALSVSCGVNDGGISLTSEIHIEAANQQFSGCICFLLSNMVGRKKRGVEFEVHCSGLAVSSGRASAFHVVGG